MKNAIRSVKEIIDGYLRESEIDFIAMPQLASAARRWLGAQTTDQARELSLEMVKQLYENGLRPGNYDLGTRLDFWPDEGCQTALDRIEREWIELGHDPTLGDPICWFGPPPDK
jgi:hypothetical protein